MPKIYTKVGDKGHSSLVGGQKVSKDDPRLDAYGTIDELNSMLGLVRAQLDQVIHDTAPLQSKRKPIDRAFDSFMRMSSDLETIQNWLFDLGSLLASEPQDREKFKLPEIGPDRLTFLEDRIDGATEFLKPLKNFILPGGSIAAAQLHLARTIARRAERHMVFMGEACPKNGIPFINRLSDYFFTMARLANYLLAVEDVEWKKTEPTD